MRCVMSYECKFDLGKVQDFFTAIGPLALCPRMEINKDILAERKNVPLISNVVWF